MPKSKPFTNINFLILNQLSYYACCGCDLKLKSNHLEYLSSLNTSQLKELSHELGEEFLLINKSHFIRFLEKKIIPELCDELLSYGAPSHVVSYYADVPKLLVNEWKRKIYVHPNYRGRCIPADIYLSVWSDIDKLPNPLSPSAKELIELAKKHNISIGALWNSINEPNR